MCIKKQNVINKIKFWDCRRKPVNLLLKGQKQQRQSEKTTKLTKKNECYKWNIKQTFIKKKKITDKNNKANTPLPSLENFKVRGTIFFKKICKQNKRFKKMQVKI